MIPKSILQGMCICYRGWNQRGELDGSKNAYQKFSEKMYLWSQNPKDRKELLTAIYLYVYLNRKEEDR